MVRFQHMTRLVLTTLISFLISFGAISKNALASELIKHVTTEHVDHSHNHKHVAHDHHSDSTQESGQPEEDSTQPIHSHSFEMSFLTVSLNVLTFQNLSISTNSIKIKKKIESVETCLDISHFSKSVFRPPIA